MHPELIPLEAKREQLHAKLAAARLSNRLSDVSKLSVLISQCEEKIMDCRVLDSLKRGGKDVNWPL